MLQDFPICSYALSRPPGYGGLLALQPQPSPLTQRAYLLPDLAAILKTSDLSMPAIGCKRQGTFLWKPKRASLARKFIPKHTGIHVYTYTQHLLIGVRGPLLRGSPGGSQGLFNYLVRFLRFWDVFLFWGRFSSKNTVCFVLL